ncbi:MAG TPA: 30S ribosome-binding factor RbfA [bacterium]|nr:30S ribosome-binding factor RbfA [bacterium]
MTFSHTAHLPYDRTERVADEIYRIIAEAVVSGLSDPRLAGTSVTRVKMTRDLRTAYIYFHMQNSTEALREAALRGFESSAGFLKRRVGGEIKLKFMPELKFFYDDAMDTEERIEELLKGAAGKAGS